MTFFLDLFFGPLFWTSFLDLFLGPLFWTFFPGLLFALLPLEKQSYLGFRFDNFDYEFCSGNFSWSLYPRPFLHFFWAPIRGIKPRSSAWEADILNRYTISDSFGLLDGKTNPGLSRLTRCSRSQAEIITTRPSGILQQSCMEFRFDIFDFGFCSADIGWSLFCRLWIFSTCLSTTSGGTGFFFWRSSMGISLSVTFASSVRLPRRYIYQVSLLNKMSAYIDSNNFIVDFSDATAAVQAMGGLDEDLRRDLPLGDFWDRQILSMTLFIDGTPTPADHIGSVDC